MKKAKLYFYEGEFINNRIIKLPDDISNRLMNIIDTEVIGFEFETEENKLLIIRTKDFIRIEEI